MVLNGRLVGVKLVTGPCLRPALELGISLCAVLEVFSFKWA